MFPADYGPRSVNVPSENHSLIWKMPELSVNSPLGPVTLVEADGAIIELNWRQDYKEERSQPFKYVHAEPTSYFAGQLDNFPPLNPKNAIFQKRGLETGG
jgi:hypothetical protein